MSSRRTVNRRIKRDVEALGWRPGSSLENRAALVLSELWTPVQVVQQAPVKRYTLDFAWPGLMVGLECDGHHHREPERAARDVLRDCDIRDQGWTLIRCDDRHGVESFEQQIRRTSLLLWRSME